MWRVWKNIMVYGLFLAAWLVFPQGGMAETHTRSSWYIGFGIGGGLDARYKVNGKEITFDDWLEGTAKSPKTSFNFKVGGTLSPKTLLGFDGTFVAQDGTIGSTTAGIQINNYFLMLTHFPFEEGLFLRAGGGLSNIMYEISGGGISGSDVTEGYGALVGVGYAFWLGKTFNLTLNIDHSRQTYPSSSIRPESSQFTILYVGFDWY